MKTLESLLIGLEKWPLSALWRIAFGMGLFPTFRALAGGGTSIAFTLGLFLSVLVALRIGPALLRKALPFSAKAKEVWKVRRFLAKQYDSYQWQKLLWIGIGLCLFAILSGGRLQAGEIALTAFCLIGGGAGLFLWRKVTATEMTANPATT